MNLCELFLSGCLCARGYGCAPPDCTWRRRCEVSSLLRRRLGGRGASREQLHGRHREITVYIDCILHTHTHTHTNQLTSISCYLWDRKAETAGGHEWCKQRWHLFSSGDLVPLVVRMQARQNKSQQFSTESITAVMIPGLQLKWHSAERNSPS